jgi:hypothetical protein
MSCGSGSWRIGIASSLSERILIHSFTEESAQDFEVPEHSIRPVLELIRTMRLLGVHNVADLTPDRVRLRPF